MQVGHVAVGIVIASYAPELTGWAGPGIAGGTMGALSLESFLVAMIAHWLPNLDGIPIMLGWAPKAFHCTWSHSIVTASIFSLLMAIFNPAWGVLIFASLFFHFLADMPSSVGLPIFLPLSKKRFTFNLWADTGYFGKTAFVGTYRQSWTWLLEGAVILFGFIRLYQLNIWPFN